MKVALIFAIVFGLIIFSFLYDIGAGLMHTNNPHFYVTPSFLCGKTWTGIALPPFGIWICKAYFDNARVRTHELVHWDQYRRMSAVGYYANYVWGWIAGGFTYENNFMEIEAIQKAAR